MYVGIESSFDETLYTRWSDGARAKFLVDQDDGEHLIHCLVEFAVD